MRLSTLPALLVVGLLVLPLHAGSTRSPAQPDVLLVSDGVTPVPTPDGLAMTVPPAGIPLPLKMDTSGVSSTIPMELRHGRYVATPTWPHGSPASPAP